MGELVQRLSQECPGCSEFVLAKRIEGRYVNAKSERLLIWECPECLALWQKARR